MRTMKLRHAASLALAGWCLLLPNYRLRRDTPRTRRYEARLASDIFDLEAPLSSWKKEQVFESRADCENKRQKLYKQELPAKLAHATGREERTLVYEISRLQHSQCIATDDPRLRKGSSE